MLMDKKFLGVVALSVADAIHARFSSINKGCVETTAYNTLMKLWEVNAPLHQYPYELAVEIAPRYHTDFAETKAVLKKLNFSL